MMVNIRKITALFGICLVLAAASMSPLSAAAPSAAFPHSEAMDGVNNFRPAAHLIEALHSSPTPGGSTTSSDAWYESAAVKWTDLDQWDQWHQWTLPSGSTMDVRDLWVCWDNDSVYIGVQGPNDLWEHGDLFIAIDVMSAGTNNAHWGRNVDFFGWQPDYFISVETPVSDPAGYADLTDADFTLMKEFTNDVDAANSDWFSDVDGGMYYEFRLTFNELGVIPGVPDSLKLCAYTTQEHSVDEHNAAGSYFIGAEEIFYRAQSGADTFDTAPGNDQGVIYEQLGDYPGDADYAADPGWSWGSSDQTLSAGVSVSAFDGASWTAIGTSPGSDYMSSDTDTIAQYLEISNFGEQRPVPAMSWSGLAILIVLLSAVMLAFMRR